LIDLHVPNPLGLVPNTGIKPTREAGSA
jgi:hypothetical protein